MQGFLFSIDKFPLPFHTLHLDHVGPFVESHAGNKFILTIVDAFTKFTFLRAVPSTRSKPVIHELSQLYVIFGAPCRIVLIREKLLCLIISKNFAIKRV